MTLVPGVADDQLGQYYRRTTAIADRLGKSLPFDTVMEALQRIYEGQFGEALQAVASSARKITRRLFGDSEVVISAVDGAQALARAKQVFTGYIDADFVNWGLDEAGEATPVQKVQVEEMTKNGTFRQIFGGFGVDFNRLCLTQHQVKQFCIEHQDKLRTEGYGTFFLFKNKTGDKFFVAVVLFDDDGRLEVCVYEFSNDFVWDAECQHRFVSPQQQL